MSYDDWRINGNWHRCECGARYSDSDGGACHSRCTGCKSLFENEELNDDGMCPACEAQIKAEEEIEDKLLAQEMQEEEEAFNREAGYVE